ncbi:MAG: VCBS repeat-containing protein [Deltaproteobacteria bacterium]|nr:VCBS repeat-containing protein [Deltaproteobacteria bacterium]
MGRLATVAGVASLLWLPFASASCERPRTTVDAPLVKIQPAPTDPRTEPLPPAGAAEELRLPFEPCFTRREQPTKRSFLGGAYGDVDGDGRRDIAGLDSLNDVVAILRATGDGSFEPAAEVSVDAEALGIALGDFNRDGDLDLATGNHKTQTVSILLGNGKGSFARHAEIRVGPKVGGSPTVADLNADGRLDLAVSTHRSVRLLLGEGTGRFRAGQRLPAGLYPERPLVADFNGDKRLDLAVASNDSHFLAIFLHDGQRFGEARHYECGRGGSDLALGDYDGNGTADLAMAAINSGSTCLFLGQGDGTFRQAGEHPGGWNVAAHDFDRDGRHELMIIQADPAAMRRINRDGWGMLTLYATSEEGQLSVLTRQRTAAPADEVWFDDLDRDGREDILLLSQGGVTVLRGTTCDRR